MRIQCVIYTNNPVSVEKHTMTILMKALKRARIRIYLMICEVEYVLFYTLNYVSKLVEEIARILRLFEERNSFREYQAIQLKIGLYATTTIANFMKEKVIREKQHKKEE